jgi:hypothetical protein
MLNKLVDSIFEVLNAKNVKINYITHIVIVASLKRPKKYEVLTKFLKTKHIRI